MAPAALAAPAMSMLGDRYSRRNVLLVLALVRAVVLAAAAAAGVGGRAGRRWSSCWRRCSPRSAPATSRRRPRCCRRWPTIRASSRPATRSGARSTASGSSRARSAAGVLIAAGGTWLALAATALAFALAALALAGIPADRVERAAAARAHAPGGGDRRGLPRGRRPIRSCGSSSRVLGVSTLVEGAIDVLVVLVALELLDLGAAGVGWLNSAWGVGGVIGGTSAVLLIARGCNATALLIGALFVGVPLVRADRGARRSAWR